jgi:hypothetical protein
MALDTVGKGLATWCCHLQLLGLQGLFALFMTQFPHL